MTQSRWQRALLRPRQVLLHLYRKVSEYRRDSNYNTAGTDIFSQSWDNCIILDACRYDLFAKHHTLPGRLEKQISRGGGTVEWLRGNFCNRDLSDVVYVTANPQFHAHKEDLNTNFYDVWHLWQTDWDKKLETVHPESVRDRTLEAAEQYPNKRFLVHFNQPHGPYLGETGQELVIGPGTTPVRHRSFLEDLKIQLAAERISREEWKTAYQENFELVEPYVETLLKELDGLSVVTADHGEMLGEYAWPFPFRYYNHQIGYHHKKLVTVPWLIYESGNRRDIREEDVHPDEGDDYDEVESRLEYLGYVL